MNIIILGSVFALIYRPNDFEINTDKSQEEYRKSNLTMSNHKAK